MKPAMICLIILVMSSLPLYGAATLSLEEALETARDNHPQVVEARENLHGAEARTGLALASYYPQISVAADWSKGRSFLTALESIRPTEMNITALYLKQTIYDFGRTAGSVEAARSYREATDKALAVTRQELALRVKTAFYLLLVADKQTVAVMETVKAREHVFRQAQEFFTQGIRAKVDVARAEANLFSARTALIRAENNKRIAMVELANAMGIASLEGRSPVEPAQVAVTLPERNQAQQDAVKNRSEMHQLAALKSAADSSLKTAKGSYLPVFSGTASAGYADRDFPPSGNVWAVGLNLTVPLFSGFSSVEQVREATANRNAIEARQNNLKLQIGKQVEAAWFGVSEATARMASTEKEVAAANESKTLAEGRYQEGVGSIIEVTDAQSRALEARTANIQATYDYYTALALFDHATGYIVGSRQ